MGLKASGTGGLAPRELLRDRKRKIQIKKESKLIEGLKLQLTKEQIEILQTYWPIHGDLKFHRRVANFVYFTQLDGREVVLRLTEPIHRKPKEIESELDWMNYLTGQGMKIAKPVPTNAATFMAELSGEGTYYAAVFEKAPGTFLNDDLIPTEEFIATWGSYLGKMHRLTKSYQPLPQIQRRQQWEQDESLAMALRSLDKEDELSYRRLNELMEWMRSLPQEKEIACSLRSSPWEFFRRKW